MDLDLFLQPESIDTVEGKHQFILLIDNDKVGSGNIISES